VLYRDESVVVVDKPAGLAVHRGWARERDVALTRVADVLGLRPFPVHRLDRGTSGALLFALGREAARALGAAFSAGLVRKRYLALVRGVPDESGVIDHPLRSGEEADDPRVPASTEYQRLEVFGRYSLIEARPLTGRLHQVRRHLKHIACPIIGDVNYGKGEHNRLFRSRLGLHRMFLHAAGLAFPHPASDRVVTVEAPLPPELAAVVDELRARRAASEPPFT
jgi:tRNA pseudouridine65 synthase